MFHRLLQEWENQLSSQTTAILQRYCLADGSVTLWELRAAAKELENLDDKFTFESRRLARLIALGLRAKELGV